MSFGKNPFVAKAQAAEQKAADATDTIARTSAYREAAHQWDRAAAKEKPGKFRAEYEESAARNRALADGEDAPTERVPAKAEKLPPNRLN
jgi:hypothetical protein